MSGCMMRCSTARTRRSRRARKAPRRSRPKPLRQTKPTRPREPRPRMAGPPVLRGRGERMVMPLRDTQPHESSGRCMHVFRGWAGTFRVSQSRRAERSQFAPFMILARKISWRSPVGAPVTRSSDLPHRFWQSSLGERPILTPTVKFPIAPRRFHRGQGQHSSGRPTHPLVLATS
jgi:hypothetical protein